MSQQDDNLPLSDEHRMLLHIRDSLYEGNWDAFIHDLRARIDDRPHVFDIVPASPRFKDTIKHHLQMIDRMRAWEKQRGHPLRPKNVDGRSGKE